MPKISVILPVYNGERFLVKALNSIIAQTYKDWELIIINDGSTDDSEKIIKTYKDYRIKYTKNDQNIGLIDTLNKGIDLAKGNFIARMDADDIAEPKRLEQQVHFLEKHSDYLMCGTNAFIIDENENRIGQIKNFTTNTYLQIHLLFSVPFVHPSMMIKAHILKKLKYDSKYKHAEDYDLWCRIAKHGEIANINQTGLKYRWHSTNVSIQYSEHQDFIKNNIIKRELGYIGLNPSEDELLLHKISFKGLQAKGKHNEELFSKYNELDNWFHKIIKANEGVKKYNQNALIAFLWSRWIVVCIQQKKYNKICSANFITYKPQIIQQTLRLILFLIRK